MFLWCGWWWWRYLLIKILFATKCFGFWCEQADQIISNVERLIVKPHQRVELHIIFICNTTDFGNHARVPVQIVQVNNNLTTWIPIEKILPGTTVTSLFLVPDWFTEKGLHQERAHFC